MQDWTDDQPKCLIKLRGRPLLDWQRDALTDAGISEIAIVTGYKREALVHKKFVEFHNPRWANTNMVSSLACAAEWLQNNICIVSYSDIVYSGTAVTSLMNCPGDLAVTYDVNWRTLWEKRFGDPLIDAETFRMHSDGTLAEIGNKPRSVDEVEGQYMGLLRFSPAGWAEVERVRAELTASARDSIHMTGLLQRVIDAERVAVHAIPYREEWGEFDSKSDITD
jgi:L-glutamine-phosphate cytidylyltransferase